MNSPPEHRATPVPQFIGGYRILGKLGQGGMGVVYDAVHAQSGRKVALKTVNTEDRKLDRKLLAALRSEVLALRRVEHPWVVSIVDEGLSEKMPWYAMNRIEGRTLTEWNRELWMMNDGTPLTFTTAPGSWDQSDLSASWPTAAPPVGQILPVASLARPAVAAGRLAEVLNIYRLLCEPLSHVHAQGIVHRDLKPSNVILRADRTPVLMDFGLASRAFGARGRDALDLTSRFVGSAPYVPPEQIRGEFVDPRADLYSLGCMLFETLTGRPPFLGAGPKDVLDKHLHETPVALSVLVQGVPEALDSVVLRLLAKRPRDRIGHADDIAAALLEIAPPGERESSVFGKVSVQSYLYRPGLAGRADVIDKIGVCLGEAAEGRGKLVFVGGDSGIGKTFVAAEAGRRAALKDFQVITGECLPVGAEAGDEDFRAGPLHPFSRFLLAVADRCREGGPESTQRLLGKRADVLAEYEPGLRSLPGKEPPLLAAVLPPEAARRRVLGALSETIALMAAEAPLLLILDDLQWADELSRSLLESLSDEFFRDKPVVVIGLYRLEEASESLRKLVERDDALAIRLDRLSETAMASMISDMLAMPRPPESLVRFVSRHSEGNPFFAAEYLRLLVAERILQRRSGAWVMADWAEDSAFERLELPRSIKEIVGRRLAGFGPTERSIIEAAAVLGREFEADALAVVAQVDPASLTRNLSELAERQVLEDAPLGSYRFVHDKLRAVAFEEIAPERRRALHDACGRALEARISDAAEPRLAELAYHFGQANQRAKATEYLEKAAEQALSRFANREAARFFRELLQQHSSDESIGGVPRRARWERGLGDALHGMGQLDKRPGVDERDTSRGHLEKALSLLGHPLPSGKTKLTLSLMGQIFAQVGHRLSPKTSILGKAGDRLRNSEASQAYDRLLQIFYYDGLQLEMLYATLRTLNLAELAGPSPELAMAYSIAHAVAGIIPLRSLADAYLERANDVLTKTPDTSVDSYLQLLAGVYRSGTTEWSRARDALERGLSLATSLSFHRRCDELNLALANWNFLQGRFAEARRHAAAQLLSFGRGDPQAQAWQLLMQAQVNLVEGEIHQALERARQAELLAVEKEGGGRRPKLQRSELIWTFAVLASACLRAGALEEAWEHAEVALEQILAGPPSTFYCIEAYSLVCDVFLSRWEHSANHGSSVGSLPARAGKACAALQAFARVFPAAKPRWLLHAGTRARLQGKPAQASAFWTRSGEAAKAHAMPFDEIVARWALARTLPTPDPNRSSQLAHVVQAAQGMGALDLAVRARQDVDLSLSQEKTTM